MNTNYRKRKKSYFIPFKEYPYVKIIDPLSIDVMDVGFYIFYQDRMEYCLKENQIQVIYDEDDGMPHYYALTNKVLSLHPFNMQMKWLYRKDHHGDNLIKWIKARFWRTYGELI